MMAVKTLKQLNLSAGVPQGPQLGPPKLNIFLTFDGHLTGQWAVFDQFVCI